MRKVLSLILVLLMTLGFAAPSTSAPADYPKRPIELICPFGAGGASDIASRIIAEIMKDYIDVPVNVVNIPGGGTTPGMMNVYGQPADGYSIFFVTPSPLIVESQGLAPISFTESFVAIGNLQIDVVVFSVHKDNQKFQTIEGLIEYAKNHPGEITIGGQSARGLHDYLANGFAEAAGIEITFVPYDSAAEQKSALLGREIDIYLENVSALMAVGVSEETRPFVALHDRRLTEVPEFANVPCTVEKGINFTQGSFRGLAFKKGTPKEIVDYMEEILHKVYLSDTYAERSAHDYSNIIPGYLNAEDSDKLWKELLEGFKHIFNK